MINELIYGLAGTSIIVLSSFVTIMVVYLHKKSKRDTFWQTPTSAQSVTNSAPISRRSSSSCLITIEKQQLQSRSRSASFGEDLTARLQSIATGSSYRPYAPPITVNPSLRSVRPTSTSNPRTAIAPSDEPHKSSLPSVTFQLRYEHTIETLFVTIFQLQDCLPVKNTCNSYLILYLLPNDDEKRQTQSSSSNVFNEHFQFLLKPDELLQRTLRLTAYNVDTTTRIRNTLGHVFVKFDQFLTDSDDKSFSTNHLCELLTQDLQTTPMESLGEMLVTSSYSKERRAILIRIQKIDQLRVDRSKTKTQAPVALTGYFTGQVLADSSKSCQKRQWIHTSSFPVHSSTSILVEKELTLAVRRVSTAVNNEDDLVECYVRLHLQGLSPFDQVHSQARWQHSLRPNTPDTRTVQLMAKAFS